jgi:hypothetical protein
LLAVFIKLCINLPVAVFGYSQQLPALGIMLRGHSNERARIAGIPGLFIEKLRALEVPVHLRHEPSIVQ